MFTKIQISPQVQGDDVVESEVPIREYIKLVTYLCCSYNKKW